MSFISVHDIILLIIGFSYTLSIMLICLILKSKGKITGHTARKIIHLLAGFSVFIFPFLNNPFLALIVSIIFLIMTRISKPETPVFELMAEKDERQVGYLAGPFSYALSINILVFIFGFIPQYFYFAASSILVMMISDTFAAFIGRKYGKHEVHLKYTGTVRTLEGSLGLFVSAFILSFFVFLFFGVLYPYKTNAMSLSWATFLSFLTALNSTIIELISPSNLDDLTVPITGALITFGLTYLFFPASLGLI
ncbi:MAG: diacylglycerol/polyprenol kinase family protein [Promethearchaeota archaeon]